MGPLYFRRLRNFSDCPDSHDFLTQVCTDAAITATAFTLDGSQGAIAANAKALQDSSCTTDYIAIPGKLQKCDEFAKEVLRISTQVFIISVLLYVCQLNTLLCHFKSGMFCKLTKYCYYFFITQDPFLGY